MLRQIREIFQPDMAKTFSSEKRMQRCSSVTEVCNLKVKKAERLSDISQSICDQTNFEPLQSKYGSAEKIKYQNNVGEVNQFLFCLKLKMIGISRLFQVQKTFQLTKSPQKIGIQGVYKTSSSFLIENVGIQQKLNRQQIQIKDANQILNQLSKKIKAFHKYTKSKITELQNKKKQSEIKVIGLQSEIKVLESNINHKTKQLERNNKTHSVDIKKSEQKIKQQQQQKMMLNCKIDSITRLCEDQNKVINQLEIKLQQAKKNRLQLQTVVFQKQKLAIRNQNEFNLNRQNLNYELENTKKMLLKKTQEHKKCMVQVNNLKQIIQNKQQKYEQARTKYIDIYNKLQKCQAKAKLLMQENFNIQKKYNKSIEEFQVKMEKLVSDNSKNLTKIQSNEQKINQSFINFQKLKLLSSQIQNIKRDQDIIDKQKIKVVERINARLQQLAQSNIRQGALLRQQFDIQMKITISEIKTEYQRKMVELQDYIWQLQTKIKSLQSSQTESGSENQKNQPRKITENCH